MFEFECKLSNLRIFLQVCNDVILFYLGKNSFNYFLESFKCINSLKRRLFLISLGG